MSTKKQPAKASNAWVRELALRVLVVLVALMAMVSYFQPAQEKNNILAQSDILQGKGMSKEIADYRKANDGEEPLWTSRMFGGMPAYQISTLYKNDVMLAIDSFLKMRWAFGHPIGQMFVLFLGMFFLLSILKLDPFTAGVGAFAFLLSSYFFIAMEAGHNSKINAMSYVPAVLAGMLLLYQGRFLLGAALTALFLALELNANHIQMTYYMFFIVGAIVVTKYSKPLSWPGRAFLFGGLLLMPISWLAGWPGIVWQLGAVIAFLGPVVYELLDHRKNIDGGIVGFLKGKGLTGNLAELRQFLVASLLLIGATGFAIGPNIGRYWTTSEYAAESIRGKQVLQNNTENQTNESGLAINYAFQWSYGVGETFTLLNADYFGGASGHDVGKDSKTHDILTRIAGKQRADAVSESWPTYIGDVPFTSGPVYIGVVIIFLFILGLFIVPGNARWWLLAGTLISFVLAWGRNFMAFNEAMFYNFPLYDRFRGVSMALVIAQTTIPILGALALYHFYKRARDKNQDRKSLMRQVGIAAGITAGLLLMMLIFTPGIESFAMDSDGARISGILRRYVGEVDQATVGQLISVLPSDRQAMMTAGVMRGFLFLGLAVGALAAYLFYFKDAFKGKQAQFGMYAISIVVMVLVIADLWPIDRQYLNDANFQKKSQYERSFQPSQADALIFQDPDPNFRVLNLMRDPWNDATTSYHHKTIGGYHPAKLRRYNDLISRHLDREIEVIIAQFQNPNGDVMKNVQNSLAAAPILNMMNLKYLIYNGSAPPVRNDNRLGHAWYVNSFEVLASPDEVINRLGQVNPGQVAIFEKEDAAPVQGFNLSRDPAATLSLVKYEPNHLTYEANVPGANEQLAVFSEAYYNSGKGWEATIDGQEAPHFRVNYVLRGMRIPSGKHTLEFKFNPRSYHVGSTLSFGFSLLLLAAVGGALFLEYRKNLPGTTQKEA